MGDAEDVGDVGDADRSRLRHAVTRRRARRAGAGSRPPRGPSLTAVSGHPVHIEAVEWRNRGWAERS